MIKALSLAALFAIVTVLHAAHCVEYIKEVWREAIAARNHRDGPESVGDKPNGKCDDHRKE